MNEHHDSPALPASSTLEPQPNTNRRRFIVGGIVAAPLLVTLAAQPARASSGQAYLYGYPQQ